MIALKKKIILCITLWCLFLLPSLAAGAADELMFGVHPFKPSKILYKAFSPLTAYLSHEIGQPIKIYIAKDYGDHIDNVGKNTVDIAYMGPAPYVKMVDTYGEKPLLARLEVKGKNTFQGIIIVRKDSPLQSLADLKNKKFAFGDKNSTMSHLVPRFTLWKEGVDVKDLASFTHMNNHENVAMGVLVKDFDAGAVKASIFNKYEERGLRVLAKTQPISVHMFVAGSRLSPELVNRIRKAFLHLNETKEGKAIMHAIKPSITGIAPVESADYDSLRSILRQLKELGVQF